MADIAAGVLYDDTSALVKLVIREVESEALEEELGRWTDLATSVITSIEFSRAVARARRDLAVVVADQATVLGMLAALAGAATAKLECDESESRRCNRRPKGLARQKRSPAGCAVSARSRCAVVNRMMPVRNRKRVPRLPIPMRARVVPACCSWRPWI